MLSRMPPSVLQSWVCFVMRASLLLYSRPQANNRVNVPIIWGVNELLAWWLEMVALVEIPFGELQNMSQTFPHSALR